MAEELSREEQLIKDIVQDVQDAQELNDQRVERVKARARGMIEGMSKVGFLNYIWHVREDDLIGGWCIMPVDEPPSWGMIAVGEFLTREIAEHVVSLHNQWLVEQIEAPRAA